MATLDNSRDPNVAGASILRWSRLMLGLFGCGLAVALMIQSRLGLGPWDAFHVGLNRLTGLSVGMVSIVVGVLIICGTWFLDVRPGAGTLVNMVMIGVFIDLLMPIVPAAANAGWGLGYYLLAIGVFGAATGLYLGAGLGSGPRDGLMIALAERSGWTVRRMRTFVELGVLAAGWMMGGRIGFGTVLFAFTVGPAMQWGMQLGGVPTRRPALQTVPADTPADLEGDLRVA